MKLVVKTVYLNVNKEWVEWYIDRLKNQSELMEVANYLEKERYASYMSKDPTSLVVATTTYGITDDN